MQNNIEIRNLYIGKIQKQINKLIHSVSLLNNLNTVINQRGGNDSATSSLDEAKKVLAQQNINRATVDIVSLRSASDSSVGDLNKTIKMLKKHIEKLKVELSNASKPEQITELNNKISELTNTIENINKELDEKNKQLEGVNGKIIEFENTLKQYNEILEELKKKLPQIKNNLIEQFNNTINELVKKLENPESLINDINSKQINDKIKTKIRAKFNALFTESVKNSMKQLTDAMIKLKITKDNTTLPIEPYVVTNQDDENAIETLVNNKNKELEKLINNNDNIKNLNDFETQYKRTDGVIEIQTYMRELGEDFNDFNEYFGVKVEDL